VQFGKGLGFVNAQAASKATAIIADPLKTLKVQAERLLDGYEPPLVDNAQMEQTLTWKVHLWKMSLDAALGVRYLHHHRYWSDGGLRHNGATNNVEEEEAGWKVREHPAVGGVRGHMCERALGAASEGSTGGGSPPTARDSVRFHRRRQHRSLAA
jgi:hypothetical protein